ncbi:MAG TPA: 6,7-dimethyl-8-ribityllumazine synthase [Bryobacteraceae bacterium]|jgi:6,7-dimethyl-8-ribityllumazine synthase|nr:6,7-dimethyl-8-ribityllumazine synthase [Bryobacteraceae bacterium]
MNEKTKPVFEAGLNANGLRFGVVVSRFNGFVTDRLLSGALDALAQNGVDQEHVDVVRVPGAWELSIALQTLGQLKKYDAFVCLGAVIRGDTPHFDYVAGEAARGMAAASAEFGVPVANGVLTTNTVEQATDRAGGKEGNKGFDAAMTALEMANLVRALRGAASKTGN